MWDRGTLVAILSLLVWEHKVSGLHDGEIVFPERVVNRERRNAGQNQTEQQDDYISYIIQTSNHSLHLNLQRNRDFVSKDFQHFTYSREGGLKAVNVSARPLSCYYHGRVEGMENSVVALSTCHGLRGVIYLSEVHYGIEPLEKLLHGAHRLYQLDQPDGPTMCGVGDFNMPTLHTILPSYYHLRRMKREVFATAYYVELGVVVDNLRYQYDKSNSTTVEVETIQLVNIVDGMFRPLNIRIILTNLITWSSANQIDVNTGTAGDVLGRFSEWRDKAKDLKRCDIYHLLIGHGAFSGGVIGMAFVGTVCSPRLGTSISTFSPGSTPQSHATVVAHELGHILGMNHDDARCPGNYIMHSSDSGGQNFSSCSANDFEALILRGSGTCLKNPPDPNQVISIPVCGNNIVEQGEECDCGSTQQCQNPCCNAATCTLTGGSQCAQGQCCENCKFKVGGMLCRAQANACDLPEYCNGSYALCPVDVYVMNGFPCSQSYCYSGECQNYDAQCKALLGAGTRKATDGCFKSFNKKGDQYGNCGMVSGAYQKCSDHNSLCGKLQCTGSFDLSLPNSIIINTFNGEKCISADFDLGPDIPDPGLVHEGTACGQDEACVNYQCVNATKLGFDCDIKGKCNDHGVCNNNGNCHCSDGWAPPYCDRSGYGGSIDSGPTHINTSLRDGLLIFFLLVVPILIFIIVMWIKRDAVKRRFCRRKRRNRNANQPTQVQNNNRNRNPARSPTRNPTTNPTTNTTTNTTRNQDRAFSDVFTISHNLPNSRQPLPDTRQQPPLRLPPPPPYETPQYNW